MQVVQAADDWNVDGEHGELHVHGWLLEGACHLEMQSVHQDIPLGNITTGKLQKPGDAGQPVPFSLHLVNCLPTGGVQTDRYTESSTRDRLQPVISVSFVAMADADMPTLLAVSGVTGMGLMLQDAQGRRVRPGMRGEPLFVTPVSDELNFTVTPVRTYAPLTTGTFRAVVDFQVSYD
ncbi:fimbrial protein [Enterobacter sichuanensis]|uniref:fimbrial protein n=1 Tax=Enterobacter sichuanensis TaxID=2071710 RepID=UPI00217E01FD|nr:fimbrial protein [Enterobacter sichuanensis]